MTASALFFFFFFNLKSVLGSSTDPSDCAALTCCRVRQQGTQRGTPTALRLPGLSGAEPRSQIVQLLVLVGTTRTKSGWDELLQWMMDSLCAAYGAGPGFAFWQLFKVPQLSWGVLAHTRLINDGQIGQIYSF